MNIRRCCPLPGALSPSLSAVRRTAEEQRNGRNVELEDWMDGWKREGVPSGSPEEALVSITQQERTFGRSVSPSSAPQPFGNEPLHPLVPISLHPCGDPSPSTPPSQSQSNEHLFSSASC